VRLRLRLALACGAWICAAPAALPADRPAEAPAGEGRQEPQPPKPEGDEPATEPQQPRADEPEAGDKGVLDELGNFQDIEEVDLADLLGLSTGAGEARTLEDAPSIVSVVSDEEIRRLGARTLEEVLEALPGFEVLTDNLGRGRIVVRGVAGGAPGGSDGVLVLLNGHRLNEAVHGRATAVNLDIPVDNVKKIEVRRGPPGPLDGPGGLLAVVNIVTETVDTFRKNELSLAGGSFSTFHYNFRYGTTVREVSLTGFLQYSRTGGAELEVPADVQSALDRRLAPLGIPAASLAPGATDDDRKSVDANLAVVYKGLTLSGRLKEENAGGYLGLLDVLGRQNRLSNRQVAFDADYTTPIGESGELRATLGFVQSELAEFFDLLPSGFNLLFPDGQRFVFPTGVALQRNLNTRRLGGELVYDGRLLASNTLRGGVALERESTFDLRAQSNVDVARGLPLPSFQATPELAPASERRIASVFLEDTWNPTERLGLMGGARVDAYDDVGTAVNPAAGLVLRFPPDLNLKLTYGRSFRPPSFAELYFSSPAWLANGALEPETAHTFQAALLYRRRELRVQAVGFQSDVRDLIAALPGPGDGLRPASLANVGDVRTRGVEISLLRGFGQRRSLQLGYTLQRPEQRDSGRRLPGVPEHLASVGGSLGIGPRVMFAPQLLYRSSRARTPEDPRGDLDGYVLANATLRLRTRGQAFEFLASVQNLFDRTYFDPSPPAGLPGDYPRPGRSVFVRVRYSF
jgi:iron complex outermembrane receptor protein